MRFLKVLLLSVTLTAGTLFAVVRPAAAALSCPGASFVSSVYSYYPVGDTFPPLISLPGGSKLLGTYVALIETGNPNNSGSYTYDPGSPQYYETAYNNEAFAAYGYFGVSGC